MLVFIASYLSWANKFKLLLPLYLGTIFGLILGLSINTALLANGIERDLINSFLMKINVFLMMILIIGGSISTTAIKLEYRLGRKKDKENKKESLRSLFSVILLLSPIIFVTPEAMRLANELFDLIRVKENLLPIFGFGIALPIMATIAFALIITSRKINLGGVFNIDILLLALFTFKLSFGGARDLSYIIEHILHDLFHTIYVLLLIPDHPYLSNAFYKFLILFIQQETSIWLTALLLLLPAFLLLTRIARITVPKFDEEKTGALRRKKRALLRGEQRSKYASILTLIISISLIANTSFSQAERLYDPIPQPVIDVKGKITVSLSDATSSVSDGRMRKFIYAKRGKTARFFAIMKPNKEIVICLDMCEICQPDGYSQMGEKYVFCKYCKTPIPMDTVGEPGGCNPIPMPSAKIVGTKAIVSSGELTHLWNEAIKNL